MTNSVNKTSTSAGRRWIFVMEPDRCIDCEACMVSCSVENKVPLGEHRNWIATKETGTFPYLGTTFMPENCHHCDNPPCERVCPTGATYRREDGLVLVDYDKCIGCKYCTTWTRKNRPWTNAPSACTGWMRASPRLAWKPAWAARATLAI